MNVMASELSKHVLYDIKECECGTGNGMDELKGDHYEADDQYDISFDSTTKSEETLEEDGRRALAQKKGVQRAHLRGGRTARDTLRRAAVGRGAVGHYERAAHRRRRVRGGDGRELRGQHRRGAVRGWAPQNRARTVDGNGEAVAFADCSVSHLVDAIEGAMDGQCEASQRLEFGSHRESVDAVLSLKELGVDRGRANRLLRGSTRHQRNRQKGSALAARPRRGRGGFGVCGAVRDEQRSDVGGHHSADGEGRALRDGHGDNGTKQSHGRCRVRRRFEPRQRRALRRVCRHFEHGDEDSKGVEEFWNAASNKKNCVFVGTTAQQRLLTAKAVQACGDLAMETGLGVNDSVVLRNVDIDVAMGISGTEVPKESSANGILDGAVSMRSRAGAVGVGLRRAAARRCTLEDFARGAHHRHEKERMRAALPTRL